MDVTLPRETLTDADILKYVKLLSIPHFRGVRMRDELRDERPSSETECGVLNLQTHYQQGSHWTCWYKNKDYRYYFDSFGEEPPLELLTYLKTPEERENNLPVIRRSAVVVQHFDSSECGSLCLFVLKALSSGIPFPTILVMLGKRFNSHPTPPLTIKIV